jgi:hypothetical protein
MCLWCREELLHEVVESHERDTTYSMGQGRPPHFSHSLRRTYQIDKTTPLDFSLYRALVSAYSQWKMRDSSDAANALAGTLSRFKRSPNWKSRHGIPFKRSDMLGLFWTHAEFSTPDRELIRRPQWPSWSWLGWEGHISYELWYEPEK